MILYKGTVIDAPTGEALRVRADSYLAVEDGKVTGVYDSLPERYRDCMVEDYGDRLIIPGFNDIHVHAPQWCNAGMGFSMELLPWLNAYAFPAEAHFADPEFARTEYARFVRELLRHGTTRAVIFGSRHMEATKILIETVRSAGMAAYIGKVNMDRNSIPELQETTADSVRETLELIEWTRKAGVGQVKYIITPRYVPCTTAELMTELGRLAETYDLPVQSHLDENRDEVAWVRSLHPECSSFADVYEHYGLLRPGRTIMAHCIHMTEDEKKLLREKDVLIAHCAMSNADLASGIMPLRRYLTEGLRVAAASDMGGSHSVNMREHIVETVKCSKLYWFYHPEDKPVTFAEAFYLATRAGGSFFGQVGAFEPGYDFDALVIDDSAFRTGIAHSPAERLERFVYLGDSSCIQKRYIAGRECNGFLTARQ